MASRVAILLASALLVVTPASADTGLHFVQMTATADGGASYSVSLQVLIAMTMLTLLPALLLAMTSFTRIIIVLAILRQAIGTMQTPPNPVLIGLALFLTLFVMSPVFDRINQEAVQPYLAEAVSAEQAIERAGDPLREFMLPHTREQDLALFAGLAGLDEFESPDDVPFSLLVPAFLTSELKTAFQIGFLIFLPFLIIDLVVAAVLMSMGMMMLSPMIISLPFKLMLFVLIDGWALVIGTLAQTFA
ncbi:flagellar type III secretion system pore protein FliP [Thioalkalicoccus limnaeus]|uniref:Flagellar biosynthetic protein FliP n=1 Tax=Thioalkalicoccus limnaeus TaxID=120681 RepID=A0ABV4BCA6_9GAMM